MGSEMCIRDRTVKVKTKDAVYVRPKKKLCLLEKDVKEVDTM